jgi:hypothetical protein
LELSDLGRRLSSWEEIPLCTHSSLGIPPSLPVLMAKNSTTAIVRQQVGPRQVDFKMPMRGGGGVQAGDWVENLLAGGTASTLSKIILQPFDTSKTLLQAVGELRGRYAGNLSQCMVRLVKERGLGGLYTGFLASIAVSAPSSAVFAVGYEFSKNALESTPLHQFAPVLAAALGNVTASIVRVPPEVIKQRVQAAVYKWDFTFLLHVLLSRLFQIKIK